MDVFANKHQYITVVTLFMLCYRFECDGEANILIKGQSLMITEVTGVLNIQADHGTYGMLRNKPHLCECDACHVA